LSKAKGEGDDRDDAIQLRKLARALDELQRLDVIDVIEPTAPKPKPDGSQSASDPPVKPT
jgi:hypothetical protein